MDDATAGRLADRWWELQRPAAATSREPYVLVRRALTDLVPDGAVGEVVQWVQGLAIAAIAAPALYLVNAAHQDDDERTEAACVVTTLDPSAVELSVRQRFTEGADGRALRRIWTIAPREVDPFSFETEASAEPTGEPADEAVPLVAALVDVLGWRPLA